MPRDLRPSPLGLAVLSMLMPGPLHPYGIQRLLKTWGKDTVINVEQRANLYKTIRRLHEAGLISVRQTEREQQYPERTVYELTAEGRQQALAWLADMLAAARNEYPQFPAALSLAMLLPPGDVAAALEQRAAGLRKTLDRIEEDLHAGRQLPRVTLLDDDYQRTLITAELAWIEGIVGDLRTGALTWDWDQLAGAAMTSVAPLAPDLTADYISGYGHPQPPLAQ